MKPLNLKPTPKYKTDPNSTLHSPAPAVSASGSSKFQNRSISDGLAADSNIHVSHPYVHMAQPNELRVRVGELAELTHARWSEKDGGMPLQFYLDQLTARMSHADTYANTPVFFVEDKGVIQGVIYPLRTTREPVAWKTWDQLTGSGLWTTDTASGHIMVCPQIVVRKDITLQHVPRALIVDGVLAYANHEFNRGYGSIKDLNAYSRPAEYAYWREQFANAGQELFIGQYLKMSVERKHEGQPTIDELIESVGTFLRYAENLRVKPAFILEALTDYLQSKGRKHLDTNLRMHTSFGGKLARVYENACPLDTAAGGYCVQVLYGHQLSK